MNRSHECFLKEIAGSLYGIHGQKITDLTMVFPNNRAGLFFKEYLNQVITGPVFSPEIITIQELFTQISPLRKEDPLAVIFRLYKIYRSLSGSKESFDEFYLWGDMLLHDFDQVDKYLVDAHLLFTNITDLKEIDEFFNDLNEERKFEIKHFWQSLTSGEQKPDQKEFSRLWQVLYPIYKQLKQELAEANCAYEGMLFRHVAESDSILSSSYLSERQFVVAGFNALNSCEKKLFQCLQEKGNITFYWDYDEYYLQDSSQEAGLFMRENLELFPQAPSQFRTDWLQPKREFQIFHTPSQMGQAQIAAGIIMQQEDLSGGFDENAVVLCDEELLLPVLSALPAEIEKVNVTMGLPLKQTPLFSLVNLVIALQKNCKQEGVRCTFHYKSVVDILNNQLIKAVYSSDCQTITENIIRNNQLYVTPEELARNELFSFLFTFHPQVADLPDYFLSILHKLFIFWENSAIGGNARNYQEYIYQVYLAVNKLKNILLKEGTAIMGTTDFFTRETFFKLMLQYLSALSVSFEGEPLAGLQVMGILETRTLDFKNLIVLSVNEGTMPKENVSGSFIPYHLRRGVGLPTLEEQNAMYAYYFYRLLQRAEKVTLIYNSGNNGIKTGEKSRFLHQLLLESPFLVQETGFEISIDPVPYHPVVVEKKGKVLEILLGMMNGERKISPTALDQYLECPLCYYFKYIARFEEEEAVSEEVDARMFGKLFHRVMEHLYEPFLHKTVDEISLLQLIDNESTVNKLLIAAFSELFFKQEGTSAHFTLSGRNILVFEVIKRMVIQTLRVDLEKAPFQIRGLEDKVEANILVFSGSRAVRIGGIIDRVDYLSGAVEIIDYKTGAADHSFNNIADLFDREAKKRNKAAFQTLVYGCIWNKKFPDEKFIFPSVYGLKKIFKENQRRLTMKEGPGQEVNYPEIKEQFEPMLTELLEELLNPEVPFIQTTVEEHCQYCSFTSICGKQPAQL